MLEIARMNTNAIPNPGLRRQRKITDIPAAITDRDVIQKYRSAQDKVEPRRGSLNLQKPKPPDKDDLSRRKSTATATFEVLKVIKKRPVEKESGKVKKTPSPMALKTQTASSYKSATESSPSSANSAKSDVSSVLNKTNNSKMIHMTPLSNQYSASAVNKAPLYEMDLSYLEPFGGLGLFSTTGVTGSKARMTSSSEGLRKYGSLHDITGFHDNRVPSNLFGFRLHRSSSVSNVLDDIRATLKAPLSLDNNVKPFTLKETKTEKRTPNVSSKGKDRSENKSAPRRVSITSNALKKHVTTKAGSKKASSNGRSAKSSSSNQKKVVNSADSQPAVIKPPRRAIRTQTTDDGLGEFEVMEFL